MTKSKSGLAKRDTKSLATGVFPDEVVKLKFPLLHVLHLFNVVSDNRYPNSANSVTNIFVSTLKGLETATSCVHDRTNLCFRFPEFVEITELMHFTFISLSINDDSFRLLCDD